jgi:hypothetical protein
MSPPTPRYAALLTYLLTYLLEGLMAKSGRNEKIESIFNDVTVRWEGFLVYVHIRHTLNIELYYVITVVILYR